MQQGCTHQTALIVLAHTEMLRECDRKTGDKEAVAITFHVIAADRGQPFPQRGVLDGFENRVFSLHDIAKFQGNAGRKLVEYPDHYRVRGSNALVQGLAAIRRIEPIRIRKRGADTPQNALRVERPGYRIGSAQRPGLHRSMVQRVGQNEQPRHRTVGFVPQLVTNLLHALRRPQIDIDHDAGEPAAGRVGISDVGMVSTSPTDCRMPASSMLWSLRSEASSNRGLVDDCLAGEVMNPRWLAGRSSAKTTRQAFPGD